MSLHLISLKGLRFLKQAEGFRNHVYNDVAGYPTIGVGHLLTRDELMSEKIEIDGVDVGYTDGLSDEHVLALLDQDCDRFEKAVNRYVDVELYQYQFDCLVSFCPSPETKVLTSDLRWVEIGDMSVFDNLFSFDEHVTLPETREGNYKTRRLRTKSEILNLKPIKSKRVRVITDKGDVLVTPEHKFLVRNSSHSRMWEWKEAKSLTSKWEIQYTPVFSENKSKVAGWMAGIFNGEGFLTRVGSRDKSPRLGFSQNPTEVLDYFQKESKSLGYDFTFYHPKNQKCWNVFLGNVEGIIKFLGEIRPIRLLPKIHEAFKDASMRCMGSAKVEVVEETSDGDVMMVETDTSTLFTNGFASHNCFNVGVGAFRKSTLLQRLNQNDYWAIPEQLRRWNRSGGRVVQGLINRREDEVRLWSGDYGF